MDSRAILRVTLLGGVMDSKNDYNPQNRLDNCGFCSLSKALELENLGFRNADQIYDDTIKHLGCETRMAAIHSRAN